MTLHALGSIGNGLAHVVMHALLGTACFSFGMMPHGDELPELESAGQCINRGGEGVKLASLVSGDRVQSLGFHPVAIGKRGAFLFDIASNRKAEKRPTWGDNYSCSTLTPLRPKPEGNG